MTTLVDLLNNQTRTLGTKVAFRYGTGDEPKQMTWAQYGNDIAAIALALDSRESGVAAASRSWRTDPRGTARAGSGTGRVAAATLRGTVCRTYARRSRLHHLQLRHHRSTQGCGVVSRGAGHRDDWSASRGAATRRVPGLVLPADGPHRRTTAIDLRNVGYGGEIWFGTVDSLAADLAKARPTRMRRPRLCGEVGSIQGTLAHSMTRAT